MADGIRFLVMDVDGTLTDGRIYFGPSGEVLKVFDVKDGYAIKCMLPEMAIVPVVITARESKMLELRCKELGIVELHQGASVKLDKLMDVLRVWSEKDGSEYTLKNAAYIGDDILDLQCMRPISAAGGIAACPVDAVAEVVSAADYVCKAPGGRGAVREFVEWIASSMQR